VDKTQDSKHRHFSPHEKVADDMLISRRLLPLEGTPAARISDELIGLEVLLGSSGILEVRIPVLGATQFDDLRRC